MKRWERFTRWARVFFEGNRCRFAKVCEGYKSSSGVCTDHGIRLGNGKPYCGKYRELVEDEEKEG